MQDSKDRGCPKKLKLYTGEDGKIHVEKPLIKESVEKDLERERRNTAMLLEIEIKGDAE